jgi:hypothetical protein
MIVDAHAQQARGFDDLVGDLDVGPAGLGASRGMVVDHPTTCFIILKCKHFSK